MIGRPITVLWPAERTGEDRTVLESVKRGERIEHFETERQTKDGRLIHVSLSLSPIRGQSGNIVGISKIVRDISAIRQAQTVQATLAAIVESSDDAIVGKTLDGIIMTWNAGAERIFGYTREEVIGRPITILLPPERLQEETTILSTLRRGGRIEHFETERVAKDGRRLRISLSVSPILDAQGKTVGAAKIARDISARYELERERDELLAREQAARMEAEAANRAKDAFLATISHELRTPLSPILSWSRMMRSGVLDDAKTVKALETIERSARSQAQLIDDLLDVSRIISGKLRIQVRPIDLATVVQAALDVVRPAADAKSIKLQPVLDTHLGAIAGDGERLQQVVWNLLSNAVKFTPRGGRVQVVLERVNSHVQLSVSDSGQGFSATVAEHLFDRFWQADSSITRRHSGLGLGLSIVRHIVELHGGVVRAASAGDGTGATFSVELPLRAMRAEASESEIHERAASPALDDTPLPRLNGLRVLVVDDNPDSNDVVSTLLSACGAEVRVAGSVRQALEAMTVWIPQLVVSDIGMPERDGYALLKEMRDAGRELARVPAIALTAYASRDDRLRILTAGFQAHLTKPIDPLELVTHVANVAKLLH